MRIGFDFVVASEGRWLVGNGVARIAGVDTFSSCSANATHNVKLYVCICVETQIQAVVYKSG